MSARTQVEALLTLIRESALKALDDYETHGKEAPVLDSLQKHPLDEAVNKLDFKKTIRKLEAACDQLCSTLAPPTHSIMKVRSLAGAHYVCLTFLRDPKTSVGLA